MNDLLDAARESDEGESSSDRYEKLKKEEAGTDQTEAERRFQELKDEAKKEFVEKKRNQVKEVEEEEVDQESEGDDRFITY